MKFLFKRLIVSIIFLSTAFQFLPTNVLAGGTALYTIELSKQTINSKDTTQVTIYVKPTDTNISKGSFNLYVPDGLAIESFTSSNKFDQTRVVDDSTYNRSVEFSTSSKNLTTKTAIGSFLVKATASSGNLGLTVFPGTKDTYDSENSKLISYSSSTTLTVVGIVLEEPKPEVPVAKPEPKVAATPPKPTPISQPVTSQPAPNSSMSRNSSSPAVTPPSTSPVPTSTPSATVAPSAPKTETNASAIVNPTLSTELAETVPVKSSNLFRNILIVLGIVLVILIILGIILRIRRQRKLKNLNYYNIDQY